MEGGDALVDAEQAGSSLHVLLDGRPYFDVGDRVTRNLGKRFDPVEGETRWQRSEAGSLLTGGEGE